MKLKIQRSSYVLAPQEPSCYIEIMLLFRSRVGTFIDSSLTALKISRPMGYYSEWIAEVLTARDDNPV